MINKKAFTLIELMVVITIIGVMLMLVIIPYTHYQKKAKLKIAGREISQSFYDAKNMAVSGIKEEIYSLGSESQNRAIGLYIDTSEGNNSIVTFYSYPYDIEDIDINLPSTNILKTYDLQNGIKINDLSGISKNSTPEHYDNLLFFFDSIDGKLEIYNFNSNGSKELVDYEQIRILLSYMNSTSPSLQNKLIYFKNTNIIDYEQ